MIQPGVQCFLQLLFGARSAEQETWGTFRPCHRTVPDCHVLDLSIDYDLQHQQQP